MRTKFTVTTVFILISLIGICQQSYVGDTLMSFNAGALTPTPDRSLYGIEYADGYLWATGFDPDDSYKHKLYKFSSDGKSLIDYWDYGIEFAGWNGLAYDGNYLYVADIDTIRQIDMTTGQKTGVKIPGPEYYLNGLTYDPLSDHFWVGGDGNIIYEIDRDGSIVSSIDFITDLPVSGLGWDSWTEGGPYLWIWSMKYTPSDVRPIAYQLSPLNGTLTYNLFEGVIMNPNTSAADYSLGATITDQLIPGKVTLLGMHGSSYQQPNDQLDWLVAYDLDPDGVGLPGPVIDVDPEFIENDLVMGDSIDIPISIFNYADLYPLDWYATLEYPGTTDTSAVLGDTLDWFNASFLTSDTNTRMRGIAYTEDHIYVSTSAGFDNKFYLYKIAKDGSDILQTFSFYSTDIGWRSITSDGRYIYGSDKYTIVKFDPDNGTIVESYLKNSYSATALAYDPQMEHFYMGNGTGAIKQINKNGDELNFIVTDFNIQGLSWDDWSPDGPYLWVSYIDQADSSMHVARITTDGGVTTGIVFNGINLSGTTNDLNDIPSDIIVTPNWQQNKLVLLALQQNYDQFTFGNDFVAVYDLATTPPPGWIELLPGSYGNTTPQQVDTLKVRLKAIMDDTLVFAHIVINNNDVINPKIIIPVNFAMINPLTHINSNSNNDAISTLIYPNPAESEVTVEINGLTGVTNTISIIGSDGRTVNSVSTSNGKIDLDVSQLKSGFYIISVKNRDLATSKLLFVR